MDRAGYNGSRSQCGAGTDEVRSPRLLRALLVSGVVLRLSLVLAAGNSVRSAWSGGGDAEQYVILASNLFSGSGYTYFHQPTAFRPPLYPLVLAGFMWLFGGHWVIAVRLLQFLAGLATVWLCGSLANRLFGEEVRYTALLAALFFPTLVYFTGEILTECFACLLTTLFFWCLLRIVSSSRTRYLLLAGLLAGLSALLRFNGALLLIVLIAVALKADVWGQRLRRVVLVTVASGAVLLPWMVRTEAVFGGKALYSTHSGYAAAEGVLMPMGRAQPGEGDRMERVLNWGTWDLERNDPARLRLPSEPELNRDAWRVARRLWRQQTWRLAPTVALKLSAFWLSLDQVFMTHSFSNKVRLVRWTGVAAYWTFLLLGITGWFRLRATNYRVADFLLVYALLVTLLHIPLVMNTRLRVPFVDPMLAILAAGAWRFRSDSKQQIGIPASALASSAR